MMEKPWFKNAIILFLISTVLTIAWAYFLQINMFIFMLIAFALVIYFIIKTGREERINNGGYISYGQVLLPLTYMLLLSGALSTLFGIIFNQINPDFGQLMMDKTLEDTMGMLEMAGIPEDAMEEAEDKAKAEMSNMFSISNQLLQYVKNSLYSFIVAAIASIFLKKENKEQMYL
jgi:predicted PurR-regulated permease PerM